LCVGLSATISARGRPPQAALDRDSTALDRGSTTAEDARAMFKRAGAPIWSFAPIEAAVAETIDRGFDWGSAAVGAGLGAALSLLLMALAAALRGRRTGSGHRGGGRS